jgi:hypothetical protein
MPSAPGQRETASKSEVDCTVLVIGPTHPSRSTCEFPVVPHSP